MNATYYPAATLRLILLVFTVFLLGLAGTLLAATESPADKEKPLASDKEITAAIEKHLAADPTRSRSR
jgi:hypothetical protein